MASLTTTTEKPKKKGVFKALKMEFQNVKTKWGQQIKIFYSKPPFPARCTRTIPRTQEAQAYDVDELRVRLWFDSPDIEQLPVRVEVDSQKTLPKSLADLIASAIEKHWKKKLTAELELPEHLRTGWLVQTILEWCETKYGKFLQLDPSLLEGYLGFDDQGMTSRRYTILVKETEEVVEVEEVEEKKVELTKEEIANNEERARRKALEKQKVDDRERELKRVEAGRKRAEAERLREAGVVVVKALSKADKAAMKVGKRQAKTGSRRTKYTGPGSAADKAKGKGKKKS